MTDQLITLFGGGGFLGRYVAQDLLRAGHRVRVAQRDPRSALFLKTQGAVGQTQFVATDLTRADSVARALAGADGVVNLVGILNGRFDAVQRQGAENVARAAAAAGCGALVHISAIGADARSASAYGRSKGEGEAAVRAAFPAATILRPSIVFGREDQFINRFAGLIATAPVVPVLKPDTRFQPVYVGDVAAAAVAALADPGAYGGTTFELGGPDVITMGALVRWINDETGRGRVIVDLPDAAGAAIASLGFLPGAPITKDQWRMLQADNVVSPQAEGIRAFGIDPTPMSAVAPAYLVQYRKHGRFAARVGN
ncbi:complex I NDUFA9 subunit family protein [Sphingomonas sp. CCH15-F11]|uniref:complex I NDUFA9 subunit family protein n=2 Tax=unclassified Sphingomonas TaxID=196159 RepID=UPI0008320A80|nr:complex I NDUFA9 subunit family protein [Sphingomonas sp. CCH15-F11]